MVDWDAVERLRSKGWDWDRIAGDPKVGFQADADVGEPGRALRALYYQRRSKSQRRPSKSEGGSSKGSDADERPRWGLARIGYILVPLFLIWFVLAYFFPSPVGTFLPAIPWLGVILAGSGFVLAWGLLRTEERWSSAMRNSAVLGVVLGIVIAGGIGLVAIFAGCPTLPPVSSTSEPSGWEKVNAPAWTDNGAPVFFFVGSVACPFCSAGSWAMKMAMQAFGPVSGTYYGASNPNDNYPNTPEVVLASTTVRSQYVSFQVLEGLDFGRLSSPPAASCTQSAYVSAYDTGGSIPFLVINGQYVHVGSIVDPGQLAGLSAQQVQDQMNNQTGNAWNAISPAGYLLEAFFVKSNGGGGPPNVVNDANVKALLSQIH